jgi:diguanylate cyclase (GGDEF)-like protein/PAS domain S-box-containing protein
LPGTPQATVDAWRRDPRFDSCFAPILQLASFAIVDFSGRIVAVNQPVCETLGYEAEELVGNSVMALTHPDHRDRGPEILRQALASEIKTYSVEKRLVRRDGSSFWALVSGTVICDPQTNEPQFLASLIQDIDARKKAEVEAAAMDSRWRFALETAGQGIWDYRVEEARTFYSDTWKALIGRKGDEVSDSSEAWQAFVHPDDLPRVLTADKDHLAGATPHFECEFRMRHKDGHWVWILDKGKVVERDAIGRPLRMIGTYTDISAIKAAEELLRQTSERFKLLAENATDVIMRVNRGGRRLYVSPACRRLLGWEPEEMLGISTRDALHPDDVAALAKPWMRAFESDQAVTLTYRMRRKDGRYIWVESISRALPTVEGETPERILVVRDIDQRVAAEQKLKDSEARYRLLAECATDMIFQLDHDLKRRYVSPACREVLGYAPDEMLGAVPVAMVHPDDAERVARVFQSVIAGEVERASVNNRIRHRDGRWIWVDAELRLLRDSQTGAPSGIVGSLRDVSERKEAEERLEQENRQLALQAAKDGLTGLLNRRAFDETLQREFRRSIRESGRIGLIMIDVDDFKSFNDLRGHSAGDACLRSVGAAIAGALQRPGDCAARYGGDEFVVLLPNTNEAGALEVAERVLLAVKRLGIDHSETRKHRITVSAGAASVNSDPATTDPDALVQAADRALYAAKRAGRDAVVGAAALLLPHVSSTLSLSMSAP